ncbi:MAG: hypothetical protein NVSMB56_13550 [Pyrinomonadaceae bacterium]
MKSQIISRLLLMFLLTVFSILNTHTIHARSNDDQHNTPDGASQNGARTLYVISSGGFFRFDNVTPNGIPSAPTVMRVTGLPVGDVYYGMAIRPATSQLYLLGGSSRLYAIDLTTNVATVVGDGTPFNPKLNGDFRGINFDPTTDRIRLVTNSGQNLRLNSNDGTVVAVDPQFAYPSGDPNFGRAAAITAVAYTNGFAGATTTRGYGIDIATSSLVTLNSANNGLINTVGAIGGNFPAGTRLDFADGFTIDATNGVAYAALDTFSSNGFQTQTGLYSINLATGAATLVSPLNVKITDPGAAVRGIALAPALTYQFSAADYTVSEGAGAVTVTVTRTGGADDLMFPSSVRYATKDVDVCGQIVPTPCASARSDYTPAFGKFDFAPGETSKTFNVLITDDVFQEATERFNVVLSQPTNGFLGAQAVSTITINDNDLVPDLPNPLGSLNAPDGVDFFVRQQYRDFLSRDPDANGFTFWRNQLNTSLTACASLISNQSNYRKCLLRARARVSEAFFRSIEFQETGYFVYRVYRAAFGNIQNTPVPVTLAQFLPDAQDVARGVIVTPNNSDNYRALLLLNETNYLDNFIQRPSFKAKYPDSLTPTQFVDVLYAAAGITPTDGERQAAINLYAVGGRARVLRRIVLETDRFIADSFNSAFVLMQYFGYLRRDPDADGYKFWLKKLNQFGGNYIQAEMVRSFIVSDEFKQRFGK